jgi:rfaE bifunctional protein nucleotidyltransferase chain/domain
MSPFKKHKTLGDAVQSKTIDPLHIEKEVMRLRGEGKGIATLNGSFDLMHAGHLEMIFQASQQADILIVALNTDRSIKEYKNPSRPIISLENRLRMMAALAMVDYVTWFDETDPRRLLSLIRPDVHVNGTEYGENCIEAEVVRAQGGKMHIVALVPGLSTSQIIKKVIETCV